MMRPEIEIVVCQDQTHLCETLTKEFVELVRDCEGQGLVALGGGNTPKKYHGLFVEELSRAGVNLENLEFVPSDERVVPFEHKDSNAKMIFDSLTGPLGLQSDQLMTFPESEFGLSKFEARIEDRIESGRFRLAILGIGPDGHTASLFPGRNKTWGEGLVSPAGIGPEGHQRMTLTPKAFSSVDEVWMVISGSGKAEIASKLIQGEYNPETCPAQSVRSKSGKLKCFLDSEAAARLQ
ncbi:MAG: 6-phosphogluconolactonase [Bdellovibrionales bacterium]|nr:6-phosphogluconolactonase [Bdellovibrionales bacterium]